MSNAVLHTPMHKAVDQRCFRGHCIHRPGVVTDGAHQYRAMGIVPGTGPWLCFLCGQELKSA
jgi:hypothetical protein